MGVNRQGKIETFQITKKFKKPKSYYIQIFTVFLPTSEIRSTLKMSEDNKKVKKIRLHIGAISKQLADDITSLESRLAKYGDVLSPLELHEKPALETYFGYITMSLSTAKYGALKGALNGVKFKGSVLTVSEAKPDWKTRWDADQARPESAKLSQTQCIRKYEQHRREIDVIPGRERTTKRKNINHMTIRVFVGNRKKILTCPKKKLWGYMKDRQLDHLVANYSHGKWRDHNGDIVETVDFAIKPVMTATKSKPSKAKENNTADNENQGTLEDDDEDEELREERERNLNILQSMFGNDEKTGVTAPMPMKINESDDDDLSDWENLQNIKTKVSEDVDFADAPEEFHESEKEVQEEPEEPEQPTTNSTSQLRALFNPTEDDAPFSLFAAGGDTDDIQEDVVMNDPIETPVVILEAPSKSSATSSDKQSAQRIYTSSNKGLFFPHFDSPFLNSQSQIASLAKFPLDKEAWEKEFYERRGEWNRVVRRRRRDVVRQIHKKNQAKRRTVVI